MDNPVRIRPGPEFGRWHWAGVATGPVLVWAVWAAATFGMILFVRCYDRNIPWRDDFALVSAVTRHERVSLSWAAASWNEHRPVVPRLILAALLRRIPDFRAGILLNVGLLSASAALSIVMLRRLRGRTSVFDAVLPLSILSISQTEALQIGFALNLVMTAGISWVLIALVCRVNRSPDRFVSLLVGLLLLLLPLCGGSGLVMLPPLMLWLTCYLGFGCWSGRVPDRSARVLGLGLMVLSLATVRWYLTGYSRGSLPVAPSIQAVVLTMLDVLSQVLSPSQWGTFHADQRVYWQLAGLSVAVLVSITVLRLASVARKSAQERPRALGLVAVMMSLLCVVGAVGLARSGFGPGTGLANRYFTLSVPLLGVVYVAWLLYGPSSARRAIQVGLLAVVCAGIPFQIQIARSIGSGHRDIMVSLEQALRTGVTKSQVLATPGPYLFDDKETLSGCLTMLKRRRIGEFGNLVDDRVAIKDERQTRLK